LNDDPTTDVLSPSAPPPIALKVDTSSSNHNIPQTAHAFPDPPPPPPPTSFALMSKPAHSSLAPTLPMHSVNTAHRSTHSTHSKAAHLRAPPPLTPMHQIKPDGSVIGAVPPRTFTRYAQNNHSNGYSQNHQNNAISTISIPPAIDDSNGSNSNSRKRKASKVSESVSGKKRRRRHVEDVNISADDRARMEAICDELGIAKGVNIKLKLYGYAEHLVVYEDITRMVAMGKAERDCAVRNLNSNQLRDIKSKIRSQGKTGKKREMMEGVIVKMDELKLNQQRNGPQTKRRRVE